MNEQAHVDMAVLEMLEEVLDEGFSGLLSVYLQDAQTKMASLQAGLEQGDADLVRSSAHSLKGSSANLGAQPLAELSLAVEQQAREGNLAGLDRLLEQIEAEFREVAAILERRMDES